MPPRGRGGFAGASVWVYALGLAPAAKDQAAQRKAEPERPEGEAADREGLAPRRKALPPAEGLALLGRQGLSSPLLSDRSACAQSEVEIVEDLSGLVGHEFSL